MFPSEAEAETALRQLRHRREALDRQIADLALYLELGRRLPGAASDRPEPSPEAPTGPDPVPASPPRPVPPAPEPATARGPDDLAAARRHGRALIAAALEILHAAGRPLHAGEIWQGLAAQGLDLPGHDPVAALNTRLWKRSGPNGPLERLGDAVYAPSERADDAAG